MQNTQDDDVQKNCTNKKTEKTKENSASKRDRELDSIRKREKQENELEKDLFDMVLEIGGLGN